MRPGRAVLVCIRNLVLAVLLLPPAALVLLSISAAWVCTLPGRLRPTDLSRCQSPSGREYSSPGAKAPGARNDLPW